MVHQLITMCAPIFFFLFCVLNTTIAFPFLFLRFSLWCPSKPGLTLQYLVTILRGSLPSSAGYTSSHLPYFWYPFRHSQPSNYSVLLSSTPLVCEELIITVVYHVFAARLYRIDISLVTSDPGDVLGDVLASFAWYFYPFSKWSSRYWQFAGGISTATQAWSLIGQEISHLNSRGICLARSSTDWLLF